jgi:hypothetical protein
MSIWLNLLILNVCLRNFDVLQLCLIFQADMSAVLRTATSTMRDVRSPSGGFQKAFILLKLSRWRLKDTCAVNALIDDWLQRLRANIFLVTMQCY